MTRVVVASSIRCAGPLADQYLRSLRHLEGGDDLRFLLADQADDPATTAMLEAFAGTDQRCQLLWPKGEPYTKDDLLAGAAELEPSHVLLVDDEILMPPPLVAHLADLEVDIVAEVVWHRREPDHFEIPNVWLCDEYGFFAPRHNDGEPDEASRQSESSAFLQALRVPGTYLVGGASSACALLSTRAIGLGASYQRLPNLSMWDDDRHFSVRAAALGLDFWADTHFPPLRARSSTDLGKTAHFWSRWTGGNGAPVSRTSRLPISDRQRKGPATSTGPAGPQLLRATKPHDKSGNGLFSACLIVKDEVKALPECLRSLRNLVDEVVVYDTGSTDATVELARSAGARVVEGYWDDDFSRARNACLDQCKGEWILWIDADERFVCPNNAQLRHALRGMEADALAVDIFNLGDDPSDTNVNVHRALRIFRKSTCKWYGAIHEQVDLLPGCERTLTVVPLKGAHIDHIGYRGAVVAERDKLTRNLRLAFSALTKGNEHRGQEGVAEMNVARALAAMGRCEEAQPYFDAALAKVAPGIATRATLIFAAQNLVNLGRHQDAAEAAQRLVEVAERKDIGYYMWAMAERRLGRSELAVELLEKIEDLSSEDGFVFPESFLHAELAGALCEAGRPGEAADHIALLVEGSPEVPNIRAALKLFAAAGKSLSDLAATLPENRLDKIAAALVMVPPVVADPAAEALFERFGPRPHLLAAAIKFAPMLGTGRALDWSARLRSMGIADACPLIAQARIEVLEVPARVRAAATAHAAFGDEHGAELAVALAPGLHEDDIVLAVAEVRALSPALTMPFARSAASAGAPGAGPVGDAASRKARVAAALDALGETDMATQIRNQGLRVPDLSVPYPQPVAVGADR